MKDVVVSLLEGHPADARGLGGEGFFFVRGTAAVLANYP